MAGINNRIREARLNFELTQESAASLFGVPFSTYKRYESTSEPNINTINGFITLGVNANWLLTGEGEMLIKDMTPSPGSLDKTRLQLAIYTVEQGLSATGNTMDPAKKAEIVMAVYDLFEDENVNKNNILKLVKLAA